MSDIIKNVYLCGPITGCSYGEATNWRQYVSTRVAENVRCLDPMRAKDYLKTEKAIGQSYEEGAGWLLSSEKHFFSRDVMDVLQNSNMILANFLGADRVSIGSISEMGMGFAARVPIVMVIEDQVDGKPVNCHDHPFTRQMAGWRVPSLDMAIDVVNAVVGTLGHVAG